jgi:hypothetical protein
MYTQEARGSVFGWGTILQARRSRVRFLMRSLDFSIDLILPEADWASNRKEYQEPPWGVKSSRHIRLASQPSVSQLSTKCGGLDISQPPRASKASYRDSFTFLPYQYIHTSYRTQMMSLYKDWGTETTTMKFIDAKYLFLCNKKQFQSDVTFCI